jgi:hypothetical protein
MRWKGEEVWCDERCHPHNEKTRHSFWHSPTMSDEEIFWSVALRSECRDRDVARESNGHEVAPHAPVLTAYPSSYTCLGLGTWFCKARSGGRGTLLKMRRWLHCLMGHATPRFCPIYEARLLLTSHTCLPLVYSIQSCQHFYTSLQPRPPQDALLFEEDRGGPGEGHSSQFHPYRHTSKGELSRRSRYAPRRTCTLHRGSSRCLRQYWWFHVRLREWSNFWFPCHARFHRALW